MGGVEDEEPALKRMKLSFARSAALSNSSSSIEPIGGSSDLMAGHGRDSLEIEDLAVAYPLFRISFMLRKDGFEIRRYNSTARAFTSLIQNISLVEATKTGFQRLFDYIQGKNNYKQKIEMTSPVITEVEPCDGPFCESSFVVSFYVPKKNVPSKPSFFKGSPCPKMEACALSGLLPLKRVTELENACVYTVAQYNDPLDYDNRVNEIWFLFDLENVRVCI
ncbi:hypothetical protein K1719_034913 [Acacia pycnantha]|nr:hypothetical protein K1719_034913 [Acacia pycnantha]